MEAVVRGNGEENHPQAGLQELAANPNRKRVDLAVEALHQAEGTAYSIEQHTEFMSLLHKGEALKFYMFRLTMEDHVWIALYNSFEKGEKVKGKEKAGALEKEGISQFNDIKDTLKQAAEGDDEGAVSEVLGELDAEEHAFVMKHVPPQVREYIERHQQAA